VYIKTDSYGGLDVRFPMSLKVLKKKEEDIKQQDVIENVRAPAPPLYGSLSTEQRAFRRTTRTTRHHLQKRTSQMRSRATVTMKERAEVVSYKESFRRLEVASFPILLVTSTSTSPNQTRDPYVVLIVPPTVHVRVSVCLPTNQA
jgi:hypothetical protein